MCRRVVTWFVAGIVGIGCAHSPSEGPQAEGREAGSGAFDGGGGQAGWTDAGTGDGLGTSSQAEAAAAPAALPRGDGLVGSVHVALGVPVDSDPADDYFIDRKYWVGADHGV